MAGRRQRPVHAEEQLKADAERYRLEAMPLPIAIDDVKKVLSAGCPVHVSMNTGSGFSDVGRDGVFKAAEGPSGSHGRHAMLIVGYVGNFYTLKNSLGYGLGRPGILLRTEKCPGRLRSGVCCGVASEHAR